MFSRKDLHRKKMRKDEIKKHIIKPDKLTFSKNLALNKKVILQIKEAELNRIIAAGY